MQANIVFSATTETARRCIGAAKQPRVSSFNVKRITETEPGAMLTCDNENPVEPGRQVVFHLIMEVAGESSLHLGHKGNQKCHPQNSNPAEHLQQAQSTHHLNFMCSHSHKLQKCVSIVLREPTPQLGVGHQTEPSCHHAKGGVGCRSPTCFFFSARSRAQLMCLT